MSFTPLPKIFTDTCAELVTPSPRIMELGCGDGRFAAVLSDLGLASWGLDRRPPALGTTAQVVGEAAEPPVRRFSLDLLLVPNLLRHMLPSRRLPVLLDRWLDLLKPGGSMFIFEDEPGGETPAEENYRHLQEFLSRLMPESRGPLLTLAEFEAAASGFRDRARWEFGRVRSRYVIAADPVLEMLGAGHEPGSVIGRLAASIRCHGLDPGKYWWARAQSPAGRTDA